ncbi:hypothetical protein GCM10022196_02460 [Aeromicrobium flavum]
MEFDMNRFNGKLVWFVAVSAAVLVGAFAMGAPPSGFVLILLLACPLMMLLFMPETHGEADEDDDSRPVEKDLQRCGPRSGH